LLSLGKILSRMSAENMPTSIEVADIGRIYIKGYLYPIQKSLKRIFPYHFSERDMLRDPYPYPYPYPYFRDFKFLYPILSSILF
jgi:hypothetical protein